MADVRKIKVKQVSFNREFKPPGKQFIIYYFNLETDDDMVGEFSTNGRNQTKFLVGEEYEVEVLEKSNRGGFYNWFDYTEAEKEKRKGPSDGYGKKGGSYSFVRSRKDVLSIISQSSYEAAVIACAKIAPETITNQKQVADISKRFFDFICDVSGLNSSECKSDNKIAMKEANEKSIVYQKSLKLALQCLDIKKFESEVGSDDKLKSTQGLITLTEVIFKNINDIANV